MDRIERLKNKLNNTDDIDHWVYLCRQCGTNSDEDKMYRVKYHSLWYHMDIPKNDDVYETLCESCIERLSKEFVSYKLIDYRDSYDVDNSHQKDKIKKKIKKLLDQRTRLGG